MMTWFFHVSPHIPERLIIDGKIAPGYIVLMPETTGLSKPLMVVHPSQEMMIKQTFDVEPVTQADWIKANERNLMKWAKETVDSMNEPYARPRNG